MKLGYTRMPNPDPISVDQDTILDQIDLADKLGLELAYLPSLDPKILTGSKDLKTQNVHIGLDATAFGELSPRDLERAIRTTNDALWGKLVLGVEMGCGHGSTQSRAQAQNFETMFSQAPRSSSGFVSSRYPMKSPCPKIIGLPAKGTRDEVALAAACGYLPMTPSWLKVPDVARHWPAIVEGATASLRRAHPDHWKLARSVIVHNDRSVVQDYLFGSKSPVRKYYTRLAQSGLIDMDVDKHMKRVVIAGSPNHVADQLLELQESVCEIGTLQMVDHHDRDPEITRNTMVCLAETVLPMVNNTKVNITKELERT
ncbi:MAG: hypothetical protein ABJG56_14015 [Lentilitoribacter sp.]